MYGKTIGGVAAALAASLAVAGAASATPGSLTFDQTYPVASQLCVKASSGTLPKRLQASQSQVIVACSTLQGAFSPLQTTVQQAEETFANTIASDKAKVAAVCPPANAAGRPACRDARTSARLANHAARLTLREAAQTYRDSVESNRLAFWNTISSLRSSS